ncbi:MAG TPA: ABC transporter permease [Candidatus Dormibacteraeota bacterium]|nr:ABC transporter permease [Candidatus Dormibacteraeota bacterium]
MAQSHRENLKQALDTLRTHKLRSLLTVLGVVLGVSVIMLVAAIVAGFDKTVTDAMSEYGNDTAFISRFDQGPHNGRRPKEERMRKPLTLEDGEAIQSGCPAVKNTTVWINQWENTHKVQTRDGSVSAIDFRGVFANFAQVYANANILDGRFFTEAENIHRDKVVVIGENVGPVLFPGRSAVGKDIFIDGSAFMVVGVVQKPKGGMGPDDEDRRVLIPYLTFRKIYPGAYENAIRIQSLTPAMLDAAVDQARDVLRRRRNVKYSEKDNFSIETAQQSVQQFHEIVSTVFLATIVLSSIGLLIGGVGVMNIMLVSVTERTREIGIRKAIGAHRSDITWQFLLEAMTLTGVGGIIALVFVNALVFLIRAALKWQAVVPLWAAAAGLTVSISIGLIFGVWPAVKAARLDPVEALRYE